MALWCPLEFRRILGFPPIFKIKNKVTELWRIVWRFFEKLNIELPCDPADSLLSIYPEKNVTQKDLFTPVFTAALFPIAKTWRSCKCPLTEEWKKKMWYIIQRNTTQSLF